jgi:hypothetical protein
LLLDVEIVEFNPGRVEVTSEERSQIATLLGLEKVEAVSSIDIRRAESRYIPVQLKRTLQGTGLWGSTWVVPKETQGVDLTISGTISESDGERTVMELEVHDATGSTWLRRAYRVGLDLEDYERADAAPGSDVSQKLYDEVIRDLGAQLAKRSPEELRKIREIAELRFAQRFAPGAFAQYLTTEGSRVELRRLPARGDPMLRRTRQLLAREQLFLDTLNGHYDQLYVSMRTPYANWRRYSRDEVVAFRSLVNEARLKILGGTALVVGGFVAGPNLGGDAGRLLRLLMVTGGFSSVASGFSDARRSNVQAQSLKELGTSFDGEVAPLVVSTDQTLLRLTGTAEAQYQKWQQILQQLYDAENGLRGDPQMYLESPPLEPASGANPADDHSSAQPAGKRAR